MLLIFIELSEKHIRSPLVEHRIWEVFVLKANLHSTLVLNNSLFRKVLRALSVLSRVNLVSLRILLSIILFKFIFESIIYPLFGVVSGFKSLTSASSPASTLVLRLLVSIRIVGIIVKVSRSSIALSVRESEASASYLSTTATSASI